MIGDSPCMSSSAESSDEEDRERKYASRKNDIPIIPRPNAAPGYWLSCLLPLALFVNHLNKPTLSQCAIPFSYELLTAAAFGMCIESLCFFMYLSLESGLLLKLLISFVPGLATSSLLVVWLQQSIRFSLFWGFAVTFCYQNAYIRVMRGLPRCFSYGEAAVLVQGLMLFVFNVIFKLPEMVSTRNENVIDKYGLILESVEFRLFNMIMMGALFFLLVTCWLVTKISCLRQPIGFYILMVSLLLSVTCLPITKPIPLQVLYLFLIADVSRINIIIYYAVLVTLCICTVWWQIRHTHRASTRVRKIFHLLIVLVYVPGLLEQCTFLYLATGVALAVFTVLELFRILEIPPLAAALKDSFASFSDEKDAGLLALTPFSLLIGCSLPIWISPCPCANMLDGSYANAARMLPLLAGVWTVGVGDTAASLVGSKCGRIKWPDSHRTFEGTIAFIVAVLSVIWLLHITDEIPMDTRKWCTTIMATLASAFVEARTDQIDNLVLPLVFYVIIKLGS